jgi:hypothetical protein
MEQIAERMLAETKAYKEFKAEIRTNKEETKTT